MPLGPIAALTALMLVLGLGALAPHEAQAFSQWSTATTTGNCANCHGDFRAPTYTSKVDGQVWTQGLHDTHRLTMLGGDCSTCHGSGARFPVLLNSSAGGTGLDPVACVGCHGRAGEGGAGLRQHHFTSGVTLCASCHADANPAGFTPAPESLAPAYYFSPDAAHPAKPTDPCNAAGGENFAGTAQGLDNDGDGLYDAADVDCQPANISLTPLSVTFQPTVIGNLASAAFTLANTGGAPLTVSAATLSGSLDFALNPVPALPATVQPGATLVLTVVYAPSDVGDDTGALAIASDDPDQPTVTASLFGTGTQPAGQCNVTVAPLALDYGTVEGGASVELAVTIGNNGSADCTVSSLNVSGSTDFALGAGAPVLPVVVSLGGSVQVPVAYAPSDVGADNGLLEVVSDDPATPLVSVSLAGNGVAARAAGVSPASIDFGTVEVGGTSAVHAIAIQNVGGAPLTISDITLTGSTDFAFGANVPLVPITLLPGEQISADVEFTPSVAGQVSNGALEVASDDPASPVVSVALTGSGVAPAGVCRLSIDPLALDFRQVTVGSNKTLWVVLENIGTAPCVVDGSSLAGSSAFALSPYSSALPLTLEPFGATGGFAVVFTPAAAQVETGTLSFASNDPNQPAVDVSLTGEGAIVADIDVLPRSLIFGQVELGMTGTRTANVNNVGNADLTVTDLQVSGSADFALAASVPALPFTVAPGSVVPVDIEYTPSGGGSDSGLLKVLSDDPDEPFVNLSLSGTEIAPKADQDIDVTPTVLDFGNVDIGTSLLLTVDVTNLGERDLNVNAVSVSGSPDLTIHATSPSAPFVVRAGLKVTLRLMYAPSAVSSLSGALVIDSDDPDEPSVTIPISGSGVVHVPACKLSVTPAVNFAQVETGSSKTVWVLAENIGDADCVIDSAVLAGSADMTLSPTAPVPPVTVATGGFSGFPVIYTPSDIGTDSATLTLGSNDPNAASVVVPLSGEGIAPLTPADIDITPLALDFGATDTGTSASGSLLIANLGDQDLLVRVLTLSGSPDFAIAPGAPSTPFWVTAHGSISLALTYTPSAVGAASATLDIKSSDPDEAVVTVTLSGSGQLPLTPQDISVSPASVDFGSVQAASSASATVTVSNIGQKDLVVSGLTVSGADLALGAGAPATPFTVAGGASVAVPVSYSPAAAGTTTGNLAIASDDPDQPLVDVALSGTATPAPTPQNIAVSPATIDFGTLDVGTASAPATVTITNSGDLDLTVSGATIAGSTEFALGAASFPMVIAGGASATLEVTYTPVDGGADSATLAVASDDPDSPAIDVTLAGTGNVPPPPRDGATVWSQVCSGCHGADPTVKAGRTATDVQNAISNNTGGMGFLATTLQPAEIQNVGDYLSTLTPPPPPDGPTIWANVCAGCHGVDPSVKAGRTAADVQNAIATIPAMSGVVLNATDLATIGAYLSSLAPPPPADGPTIWANVCAGCHGADPNVKAGRTATDVQNAIATIPAMNGVVLNATDLATIGAYLTSLAPPPPATDGPGIWSAKCAGCHGADPNVKAGRTATDVQNAIATVPAMASVSLTATELQTIGDYLASLAPTTPAGKYTAYCQSCHGDPTVGGAAPNAPYKVGGARSCSIDFSIDGAPKVTSHFRSGVPEMAGLKGTLTSTDVADLEGHLNSFFVSDEQRYVTACAGCHGIDAKGGRVGKDVRGKSSSKIGDAINRDKGGMGFLSCLTQADRDSISAFLNGNGGPGMPPPPGGSDGPTIWANVCAGCHGADPAVKAGRTASDVQNAIATIPAMGSLTLSATDLQTIGDYLASLAAPPPPTDGAGLWSTVCAACHGADPTVKAGRTQQQILDAIAANTGGMGSLSATIGAPEAQLLADYLATFAPSTPQGKYAAYCQSCHGDPTASGATTAPAAPYKVAGARECSIDFSVNGASNVTRYFRDGVPEMAGLQGTLSSTDVTDLASHLNSFSVSGEKRFMSACAACHGTDARGGRVGKDVRGDDGRKIRDAISRDKGGMGLLSCLPRSDTDAIGSWLKSQ